MRALKQTLMVAVLLAPAGVLAADGPAAALKTTRVAAVEAPRLYRLDGEVEAVNRSTVSAQTTGQVDEILVDVDDLVQQGEVILILKSEEQAAGVAQAEANLRGANAQLSKASKEYKRIEEIYAKKLVAKSEMDRAASELQSARAAKEAAEAALAAASEHLKRTEIRAPYTGIVTERHVQPGEVAQPGTPLMSGISLDELRVTVDVPQSLIVAVRRTGKGYVERPGGGWIEVENMTVYPVAQPGSNSFRVRLALPKGTPGLFPGMFVKTAFVVGSSEALIVPAGSVVYRSEVVGVYVVNDEGAVSLRHVRVGHELGDGKVVVLSGLSVGERVADDPIAAGIALKNQRQQAATDG